MSLKYTCSSVDRAMASGAMCVGPIPTGGETVQYNQSHRLYSYYAEHFMI